MLKYAMMLLYFTSSAMVENSGALFYIICYGKKTTGAIKPSLYPAKKKKKKLLSPSLKKILDAYYTSHVEDALTEQSLSERG